ncbi:hypothetical protein WISP_01214 [Willisornis vidua]|uniref:NADH dehydrogenase subunit 3 n=1 Tax=Willisornis vidua TaxID=1566151 RepID=A0ABQ9DUK7_9PASS|nr:hypothetical protein WISP_01214 [Willisornis vidua]
MEISVKWVLQGAFLTVDREKGWIIIIIIIIITIIIIIIVIIVVVIVVISEDSECNRKYRGINGFMVRKDQHKWGGEVGGENLAKM